MRLLTKTHTSKTISAANAIEEERRIRAIDTVKCSVATVRIVRIGALMQKLGVKTVRDVDAIIQCIGILAVENVFTVFDRGRKVAVFRVVRLIRKITVLRIRDENTDVRNSTHELDELIDERSLPIDVLAVGNRIPRITPPLRRTVDSLRLIGRVNGDDGCARTIACSTVERLLVPKN